MKWIGTLLAAGAIASAGLLLPATASAETYWCKADSCYTDGTPKADGLNYWQAKEKAEAEEAADPTPTAFDNLATIAGWFTGSAGGGEETTPAP